ncbi:MAG: ComEC/Rec2 family competence protein, partial [Phycisphaeraceae bacterium]|nr:ComEC/Rec2 family competence protein [Phycisphaeraceae bacterium]
VSLTDYDDRIGAGDRVRCSGWLRSIEPPKNPGQYDYARSAADEGIRAQLYLKQRGHLSILQKPADGSWRQLRGAAADAARIALHRGVSVDPESEALLEMLLLGTGREDLGPLNRAFTETGLAHLLAISGLHLGILAAGIWWAALVLCGRPSVATVITIAAVVSYLMLVPGRVPVLRAGLMTLIAVTAAGWGRRIEPLSILAAAALPLLLWRPWDLLRPGFQLSFLIVAALILFTPTVSEWLQGEHPIERTGRWRKWFCDYMAVCLVAWAAAMPLVCFHFQKISPLSMLLTPLLLPLVACVLWAGYLKLVLTLLVPAAGQTLGPLVGTAGQWLGGAVSGAAELPGVVFYTPPVSVFWLIGMGLVVWGTLSGRFASRPVALVMAWGLCGLWLMGPVAHRQTIGQHRDTWQLHAWAVGNGSAYLIQSGGRTILYDCGSSTHAALTETIVDPALRSAGVQRIDTLILSHPDLDHFSGTVELVDRFQVGEVWVNEAFVEEARVKPDGAASVVLEHLQEKKIPVRPVHAGWRHRAGRVDLEVLWPDRGARFDSHNDGSLVISLTGGGRRLLLCGDVQDAAMKRMAAGNLPGQADVLEIPHHGSLAAEMAPKWAGSIRPQVAIQSTAEGARTRNTPWKKYLPDSRLCITSRGGAVRLRVGLDGTMHLWRYGRRGWTPEHPPTYNMADSTKEPANDAKHPSGPADRRTDRADGLRTVPESRRADQVASP